MSNRDESMKNLPPSKHVNEANISRREFMEGAAAVGTAAVVASSLSPTEANAAKSGGHFKLAMGGGGTTDSLDPGIMASEMEIAISYTMNGFLTSINPDGETEGDIAESWEASDGGKKWVFKVRKGAEFHNGKSVTSDDVVASINYHRGEGTKSTAKSLMGQIAEIKSDGSDTVEMTLHSGNADFAVYFSDPRMGILPSEEGKINWQSGVAAGPYALSSFEPGVSANFSKAKNDWDSNRGFIDTAEMLLITDPNARVQAIISGAVDAAGKIEPKVARLLQSNNSINLHNVTTALHYTWPMNTTIAPFDNNDVRMAMKYAFDREEFVEKILGGFGTVANDHPVSPSHQFFAEDLEQREIDLDKAKHHLKKAGLSSLDVEMSASDGAFAGSVDSAQLFAASAKKAGINVTVVREPADGYWSNVWMKKPFCACYWSGRPTADWILTDAYTIGASYNESYIRHERLDQLIREARSELDQNKRAEMYRECQLILRDEGGTIIPAFGQHLFATSSNVGHNADFSKRYELDDHKGISRWWFKS